MYISSSNPLIKLSAAGAFGFPELVNSKILQSLALHVGPGILKRKKKTFIWLFYHHRVSIIVPSVSNFNKIVNKSLRHDPFRWADGEVGSYRGVPEQIEQLVGMDHAKVCGRVGVRVRVRGTSLVVEVVHPDGSLVGHFQRQMLLHTLSCRVCDGWLGQELLRRDFCKSYFVDLSSFLNLRQSLYKFSLCQRKHICIKSSSSRR